MNFITANNKPLNRKNSGESFISVFITVLIIVIAALSVLSVIGGTLWFLSEVLSLFIENNLEVTSTYQSIHENIRFALESLLIIIAITFVGSILIWANINSKKP